MSGSRIKKSINPASANASAGRQKINKSRLRQGFGGQARKRRGFTPHLLRKTTKKDNPTPRAKGAGFTMLEILVVVAIFSLLSVVIIDVYLLSLKSQRQTSYRQKTLSSVRYALETMARQVRTSEINYWYENYPTGSGSNLGPLTAPEDELALLDQSGQSIIYRQGANDELQADIDGQVYLLTDPNELKVVNLDFYISPAIDPFSEERCNQNLGPDGCSPTSLGCTVDDPTSETVSGFCRCQVDSQCLKTQYCDKSNSETPDEGLCLPPNQQPQVTMVLGFMPRSQVPEEQKLIFLQTTISSRIYKR